MPVNNDHNPGITERNHLTPVDLLDAPLDLDCQLPVEQADKLEHIFQDVHEILRRLHRFEEEARPLLDAYKRTNGGTIGLLREARRSKRGT